MPDIFVQILHILSGKLRRSRQLAVDDFISFFPVQCSYFWPCTIREMEWQGGSNEPGWLLIRFTFSPTLDPSQAIACMFGSLNQVSAALHA